jgi:predicted XRE-type DNA-binding protein
MKKNPIEVSRGSGNVFRDLKIPNPDLEQLRAILAARIIKVLDKKKLTVRQAHEWTGIAAADFSRIRRANIGRFTVDRLMIILDRLGQGAEVSVSAIDGIEGTLSQQKIAEAKTKNIIDMALTITAMTRLFEKNSIQPIARELGRLLVNDLIKVKCSDDYEKLHRSFCEWFVREIQTAEKKKQGVVFKKAGRASYGQAAKILDIVAKVYVYYCSEPTPADAQRLLPLMHGAVDTQIMRDLKATFCDSGITAKTIGEVDREIYIKLQELVAEDINGSFDGEINAVQYDDIKFRELNRVGQP